MPKSTKNKAKARKPIPPLKAVLKVVRTLRADHFEAFLAGGCVRDKLLGKVPKDYDVATNAVPNEVRRLFPRTLTIGAQFGVIVVLTGGRQIEVATFRSDASYKDGRRPEKVVFTDAQHDAERRDFTINGMFYDPVSDKVIDYVGGKKDLQKKIIRAIGNPNERFAEDHLRMLRAIRFAARLDFKIDRTTQQAICEHAAMIQKISAERIATEFEQILTDPNRTRGLQLASDSGLLQFIFPQIPAEQLTAGMTVVNQLPKRCSFALALTALLTDCTAEQVDYTCRRLKSSNQLRQHVKWLHAHRRMIPDSVPLTKGQLKLWLAKPLFEPLLQLNRSYLKATGQSDTKLRHLRRQINELGSEAIAPPRLLNGHDLIRLGTSAGPMVGRLVEELYLAQLENEVKTKSEANTWVKLWLEQHREEL